MIIANDRNSFGAMGAFGFLMCLPDKQLANHPMFPVLFAAEFNPGSMENVFFSY